MDQSRKTIVLRNKEMNSQRSLTPTQRPHSHKKWSNRKGGNENSAGVAYAELQIVFENLHQLKIKTSSQIKALENRNLELESELLTLREHTKKCENYECLLQEQKIKMETEHRL